MKNRKQRIELARSQHVTAEQLEELFLEDKNPTLLRFILSSSVLSGSTLRAMYEWCADFDEHPKFHDLALARIAGNAEQKAVKKSYDLGLAKMSIFHGIHCHQNCPTDLLHLMAQHERLDNYWLGMIVFHPNADKELIEKLFANNPELRVDAENTKKVRQTNPNYLPNINDYILEKIEIMKGSGELDRLQERSFQTKH